MMKESVECLEVNDEQGLASALKVKKIVVALFYATWCPFCLRFLPAFQKAARGKERLFVLVRDDEEKICDGYSVDIFPTVLCFENGVLTKRLDGERGTGLQEKQLSDFLAGCDL